MHIDFCVLQLVSMETYTLLPFSERGCRTSRNIPVLGRIQTQWGSGTILGSVTLLKVGWLALEPMCDSSALSLPGSGFFFFTCPWYYWRKGPSCYNSSADGTGRTTLLWQVIRGSLFFPSCCYTVCRPVLLISPMYNSWILLVIYNLCSEWLDIGSEWALSISYKSLNILCIPLPWVLSASAWLKLGHCHVCIITQRSGKDIQGNQLFAEVGQPRICTHHFQSQPIGHHLDMWLLGCRNARKCLL